MAKPSLPDKAQPTSSFSAELFETSSDATALVADVNGGGYNQPTNFWPVVLNATGHVLATGAEPRADTMPVVGSFYQDVVLSESRTGYTGVGGILQDNVWSDIQASRS